MTDTTHGNRTQMAAAKLRQMIVAGTLRPGQRISEREIVEHLPGLSRTPLREALKMLAAEGLVVIAPNRGATVAALTIAEVEDALELVIGLESLAAARACERASEAAITEIEGLHRQMLEAFREQHLMDYFEINQAIHQKIVDAAGNGELSRVYAQECARIKRYRYAGNRRHERWERAIAEHDALLAALKERDGALLRELLRAHHRSGWRVARPLVESELAGDSAV